MDTGEPSQEQKFEVIHNIAEDPLVKEPQGNFEDEGPPQLETAIDFANIKNSKEVGPKVATYVERMLENDPILGTIKLEPKKRDALFTDKAIVKEMSDLTVVADRLMGEVKAGKSNQDAMNELSKAFMEFKSAAVSKINETKTEKAKKNLDSLYADKAAPAPRPKATTSPPPQPKKGFFKNLFGR